MINIETKKYLKSKCRLENNNIIKEIDKIGVSQYYNSCGSKEVRFISTLCNYLFKDCVFLFAPIEYWLKQIVYPNISVNIEQRLVTGLCENFKQK